VDTGAAFDDIDGNVVLNSTVTNSMNPDDPSSDDYNTSRNREFESLPAADGFTVPDLLKYLAIAPTEGDHGGDRLYVRNYGERLPSRGGTWHNGATAGVFYLFLYDTRSYVSSSRGFRSALVL
jgi:hypothetical protein